MKRSIIAALILTACAASAQLTPDTFTLTWNRQGITALVNTNVYLSDVSYVLTNCQALVGTATQNLTSCGVQIRVGDSTTNRLFIGWVENAADGRFGCSFTIPPRPATSARAEIMTADIQLTLTNGAVTITDRERKQLYYSQPLK
jgi:hypothetical protein